ncbi:MAG: hypothetical protein QW658_01215 [Candidatus Bathyarchaeia archaeon]
MDLIWWLNESKWETRSFPLFGFMLSVRQFVIFGTFLLIGVLASIPLPGIIYKLSAFGLIVLVGALLASIRVKMVPWELQLLYAFTGEKPPKPAKAQKVKVLKEETPQEMFSDSDVPLSFSGSVHVEEATKVTLLVDGVESVSVNVSPTNPRYRLLFNPSQYAVGVHELAVRVGKEEVESLKITIKPRLGGRTIDLLEGKDK